MTQSTELGTLYTPAELAALASFAHAHGMLFHIDGSRLANAAASLDVSLAAITSEIGADVVSFGGTKIGLLAGEAVVVLKPSLVEALPYLRKQSMQLASKMRFVSAQLLALLDGDVWRRAAGHANAMALRLARGVEDAVEITQPVEANAVFAILPAEATVELQRRVQVLRLERAHRRGALDVLLGHHRGGRRRVRGGDPRRGCGGRGCGRRTPRAMTPRSA